MIYLRHILVKNAKLNGMKFLVYAEEDFNCALEFYYYCLEAGIKPIIGQKIALNNNRSVILLCKDMEAFKILCRHSKDFSRRNVLRKNLLLTEDEYSHFICIYNDVACIDEKIANQIPYIFPDNYFTLEKRHKRLMENLPDVPFPEGINTAAEYFVFLVNRGMKSIYSKHVPEIEELVQYELNLILSSNLEKYFLVVWEMASWCRKRGIIYTNKSDFSNSSIICYLLKITDINPLEHNLVFDCFFNPDMKFLIDRPCINLDISKNIIRHLKKVYGNDCVACAYNRNEPIITNKAVWNYAPIIKIGKKGLKYTYDRYGDVIRFRTTPRVNSEKVFYSYNYIRKNLDKKIKLSDIPFHDDKTIVWFNEEKEKKLSQFCFNEEEKKLFEELSIKSFSDLLILRALSYMRDVKIAKELVEMQKKGYVPLFAGEEKILGETYGIILYQEQIDYLIHSVTGWSLAESDVLRRHMKNKKEPEISDKKKEFIKCAKEKGVSRVVADILYKKIVASSCYVENKAYCISTTEMVWKEAYLRAHYPSAFISKE